MAEPVLRADCLCGAYIFVSSQPPDTARSAVESFWLVHEGEGHRPATRQVAASARRKRLRETKRDVVLRAHEVDLDRLDVGDDSTAGGCQVTDEWLCPWCYPRGYRVGKRQSEWEQETLKGEWKRLCTKCARKRLNNPFNALIPMRKVAAE